MHCMWKGVGLVIDEKKLIEDIEKEFDGVCVYDVSPSQAINDFVQIVDRQPKVGEWIPVSERLPEDETLMYWTTHEDGSLVMHGYTKWAGFIYNWEVEDMDKRKRQGQVIAWTPIFKPEPYKEEVTE